MKIERTKKFQNTLIEIIKSCDEYNDYLKDLPEMYVKTECQFVNKIKTTVSACLRAKGYLEVKDDR